MKKHQLCVIRKQGDQYRPVSIRFYRDKVTGECSVSLSGFGCMLMLCAEKVIPELVSLVKPHGRFPRQLPCDILAAAEKVFFGGKTFRQ
ncbi:MAG: hypothetical protein IJH64_09010 [Oscillospiraceae bacterium]|nr:hypothetical protein [Oscillospiraceae bacterium]